MPYSCGRGASNSNLTVWGQMILRISWYSPTIVNANLRYCPYHAAFRFLVSSRSYSEFGGFTMLLSNITKHICVRHQRNVIESRHLCHRNRQSGQVLISTAIAISVLIGFAGLAADVGYLEHVKRRMQTAADAGALAATQVLTTAGPLPCLNPTASPKITSAAQGDSSLNGFTDASNGITVAVNCPPASGTYAGDNSSVEVIVKQTNQANFFMAALGYSNPTVAARAVGHLVGGSGCLIALKQSGSGISLGGNPTMNLGCAVMSNSDITCSGGTLNASYVGAAGTVDASCNASPTPVTHLVPIPDPLAGLPAPSVAGKTCATTGTGTAADPFTGSASSTGSAGVYSPGVYCGGFSFHGHPGVTFNPGTYIIAGGGISITGGTISGTGVTFYLTGNQSSQTFSGEPPYGSVGINGNGSINLSAPSTGSYAGVLMYSDSSISAATSGSVTINGTSSNNFNGALYFPNSDLTFSGTSGSTASDLAIVANTISFQGNASLTGNISAIPGGKFYSVGVLGE